MIALFTASLPEAFLAMPLFTAAFFTAFFLYLTGSSKAKEEIIVETACLIRDLGATVLLDADFNTILDICKFNKKNILPITVCYQSCPVTLCIAVENSFHEIPPHHIKQV